MSDAAITSPVCPACLNPAPSEARYHPACLTDLFGVPQLPALLLTRDDIPERATNAVGKLSISGVQQKVTLTLSEDATMLLPVEGGGQFILKPQGDTFHHTAKNEHATMQLARYCGVTVPPFTLMTLADDTAAYLIRRFDRPLPPATGRYRMEEFSALTGNPSMDKYEGTAELCADVVRRHSGDAPADLRQLLLRLAFCYLTANGDMHLKNFALLKVPGSSYRLSPAYDLLCTFFYLNDDTMALSMRDGSTGEPKARDLTGKDFLAYATHCEIPKDEARALLEKLIADLSGAAEIIARSFLPASMQDRYQRLITKRIRAMRQGL